MVAKLKFHQKIRFGKMFNVILVAIIFFLVLVIFFLLEKLYGYPLTGILALDINKNSESVRNIAVATATVLGAPFIIWRTLIAHKNSLIAKDSMITDRIIRATESLSSIKVVPRYEKNLQENWETWEKEIVDIGARHAGLLALLRVAKESERDFLPIMEIVAEYISRRSQEAVKFDETPNLSADIDTALEVLHELFKAKKTSLFVDNKSLSIKSAVLQYSNLRNMALHWVDFSNTDFRYSNLIKTSLEGCWLDGVDFRYAYMEGIKLNGAVLRGADFSNVEDLNPEDLRFTFGVKKGFARTKLPENMDKKYIEHWHSSEFDENSEDPIASIKANHLFRNDYIEWWKKIKEEGHLGKLIN